MLEPIYPGISKTIRTTAVGLLATMGLVCHVPAFSASITVVGTPHLSQLEPATTAAQNDAVVQVLSSYQPSIVCIEAMPGARVEEFLHDPGRTGGLLRHFAPVAVQLGPEQQTRTGLSRAAARSAASEIEQKESALDPDERIRLIGLQLAAFEPWSALLNWTYLDESQRAGAAERIGRPAVERLDELVDSRNEIVTLAIPLARRAGHRRMCAVDSFIDELAVQDLAESLMPLIQNPDIQSGIEAFSEKQSERWQPDTDEGLLDLITWMNSPAWGQLDRSTQWDFFEGDTHDAGTRRLMLWNARNSEIVTWLFRTLAEPDGGRVLLLIGASHRPFLEQMLESHRWIEFVPAHAILTD